MKRKWSCPSQSPEHRKKQYLEKKAQIFAYFNNECGRCYFHDPRALQIDHVDSDGANDRKKYNGIPFLNKVIKLLDSGKYQLLCANCNAIKRSELNEQPKGKQVFI